MCPISAWSFTNDQLADQALTHPEGELVGTCKEFVRTVIQEVGDITIGSGYRDCYLAIGVEVTPEQARRGDIGQVSYDPDPTNDSHVHSFIVLDNYGNDTYRVIHSNWCDPATCKTVSIKDDLHPEAWAQLGGPGWHAHFYRIADNVGRYADGTFNQAIYDCWLRNGGRDGPGYPFSDAGNSIYVHNWGDNFNSYRNFCHSHHPRRRTDFGSHDSRAVAFGSLCDRQ